MDNSPTEADYGMDARKLNEAKRSPIADALQMLDKSLAGLEMNIESLDVKLQPLQLRQAQDPRTDTTTPDHAPGSDFTNAILETAQRVNRNAQKIRRINEDLEV